MTLAAGLPANAAEADSKATHFKLGNDMEVVVIPDHRAPVVTHMSGTAWVRLMNPPRLPALPTFWSI